MFLKYVGSGVNLCGQIKYIAHNLYLFIKQSQNSPLLNSLYVYSSLIYSWKSRESLYTCIGIVFVLHIKDNTVKLNVL